MLLGEAWTQRVISEVPANPDPGRNDHSSVFGRERRGLELGSIHVRDMFGALSVLVVVQDDFVHEGSEHSVGVVGPSVNANARVGVLAAREDGLPECEAILVALVLQLVPDGRSQVLHEERLGAFGELGEVSNVFWLGKLRANLGGGASVSSLVSVL